MDNLRFPLVDKELLTELEKRFPDRMPDTGTTIDQYLLRQGEVRVIRLLRHQFDLQNQNILEK
ncbi:hypothetical protein UFOVP562_25 [uncultured Caudovirales phage]|jgi:hypothetical protein|uniref:Uncharacterized protein n=1 Tax=uncultured Caudovirales phage TaxID=2100421 RepID=A0A6J5MTR9_9CAUD|nr:hypothetical protein UFOVP562_25 [uncultured Caudovirales phage]